MEEHAIRERAMAQRRAVEGYDTWNRGGPRTSGGPDATQAYQGAQNQVSPLTRRADQEEQQAQRLGMRFLRIATRTSRTDPARRLLAAGTGARKVERGPLFHKLKLQV